MPEYQATQTEVMSSPQRAAPAPPHEHTSLSAQGQACLWSSVLGVAYTLFEWINTAVPLPKHPQLLLPLHCLPSRVEVPPSHGLPSIVAKGQTSERVPLFCS